MSKTCPLCGGLGEVTTRLDGIYLKQEYEEKVSRNQFLLRQQGLSFRQIGRLFDDMHPQQVSNNIKWYGKKLKKDNL